MSWLLKSNLSLISLADVIVISKLNFVAESVFLKKITTLYMFTGSGVGAHTHVNLLVCG